MTGGASGMTGSTKRAERMAKSEPALQSSVGGDLPDMVARSAVLQALPEERLEAFAAVARVQTFYNAGEVVVAEGDPSRDFYVVLEGEVVICRGGEGIELARMGPGATFGETALLDGGPRTATVMTAGPCRLLAIDGGERPDAAEAPWFAGFLEALAREATQRLQKTTDVALDALRREAAENQRRLAMGHFLMWIVVGMSLYTLSLGVTLSVTDNLMLASVCTNSVILVSIFAMWRMVSASPYPKSTFGLVINAGWKQEVVEALVWSAGLMLLATLTKWALVTFNPNLSGVPVFDSPFMGTRPLRNLDYIIAVTYFLLSPVQEMIARGCLQSSLTVFLEQRPLHVVQAIVLSNLIFAANHAHLSPWFTVMAFAPGIVWGVLYHRQKSLLGVAISHAIVGTYALKVLGLDLLVRM